MKSGLHARNRHAARYDLWALAQTSPALARFIQPNPGGEDTIDFANPAAVTALNRALLHHNYGIARWDVPPGYLCPPIPGRADYVHHLADLLADDSGGVVPQGAGVAILDIGVGANCIYPILGVAEYGWRFVGSDVDPAALRWAQQLVAANPSLAGKVECRLQPSPQHVFRGVVRPDERFAASMCNPPFHASAQAAAAGTLRKLRNLGRSQRGQPVRNFGGQAGELWCAGGETGFVRQMIRESAARPEICRWFTTLVSKRESLPAITRALQAVHAAEVRVIPLAHGQKQSRIVAWRFDQPRPLQPPTQRGPARRR